MIPALSQADRMLLKRWLPALAGGLIAWLAFALVSSTPLARASGLALVIVGVAMMLRKWGAALAVVGVLAFAFSPAFWSQTGGGENLNLVGLAGAVIAAAVGVIGVVAVVRRPWMAVTVGFVIFAALFLSMVGQPRSLRLTTLLAAWSLYLLVDALLLTNPRADEATAVALPRRHGVGLLLLPAAGVVNDPLFTLLIPAILLGLWLSRAVLPRWYWLALLALLAFGLWGMAQLYIDPDYTRLPAAQAEAMGLRVPFVIADGWQAASRWIYLLGLVVEQFTPFGLLLGVIGLSRLSRWYPPLGVVLMVAYATYFLFGLVYFGKDSAVLLLPLLMIQVFWMTYAVYSFGQWLQRSPVVARPVTRWVAPAAFTLLPLFLLLRIAGRA